jgi:probable DNA metabolism protein
MEQGSDMQVKLTGYTDLAGFRSEARDLLAHRVPPEQVDWLTDLQSADQYSDPQSPQASRPRNVARAATAIVPASFTRLCEFVVLHRDPHRFGLLYRLLWRFVHEPGLRSDPVDPDLLQAQHMAHAVRRDIHKMKANLKLRPLRDAAGNEWQAASHEPVHHVVEAVAPWFCKRKPADRWVLFTPERSVRCDDGHLVYGPGVPDPELPRFESDAAHWRACYDRVFAARDAAAAHA